METEKLYISVGAISMFCPGLTIMWHLGYDIAIGAHLLNRVAVIKGRCCQSKKGKLVFVNKCPL